MAKLNCRKPLLQSLVSHDPPKIILICQFAAQEIFTAIKNVENLVFCLTILSMHFFRDYLVLLEEIYYFVSFFC